MNKDDQRSSAPGLDKDQWPDRGDPTWGKSLHAYYGTRPCSETGRL